METLVDTRIEPIGTTKIQSDAKPSEFFDGHGSFVMFEPEEGSHLPINAVVVTKEDNRALLELTQLLADPTLPSATEIRDYVAERVGDVDWDKIAWRYKQLMGSY